MRILAVDTSSRTVSAALMQDGRMEARFWAENGRTHSEALFPCVESVLAGAGVRVDQIDVFAAVTGPGSFTGLRIGVSAVKAMAYARATRTVGIPTLDALAYNLTKYRCALSVPLIDARNNQVYAAIYGEPGEAVGSEFGGNVSDDSTDIRSGGDAVCGRVGGGVRRLSEEMAADIHVVADRMEQIIETLYAQRGVSVSPLEIVFNGDAAPQHFDFLCSRLPKVQCRCAAAEDLLQDAAAAVRVADYLVSNGEGLTMPDLLIPRYLRPSQAERLRREREGI